MDEEIWPLTVIPARYQGIYEGGRWLAFYSYYWDISPAVYGDDISCRLYFDEISLPIGRGSTPEEAIVDLEAKLRA